MANVLQLLNDQTIFTSVEGANYLTDRDYRGKRR
jgi:hypothetical protein